MLSQYIQLYIFPSSRHPLAVCPLFNPLSLHPLHQVLQMAVNKLYMNNPLGLVSEDVRLLELQPGAETAVIQCKFLRFPLSGCLLYVALSYTWGSAEGYRMIIVDNNQFPIRRNL
ncbi:hypothetical protein AOQ84DRAFT_426634, partial [Glonium stellatum]